MEFPILGRLGVREAWRQADQLARLARRLERLPRWQWCLVADLYEEAQPWPPTIRRLLEFVQVAGLTEPGPTAVT